MEILAGNKNIQYDSSQLFNNDSKKFLNELSSKLFKNKSSRHYPDVITFAFWCRKSNLDLLEKDRKDNYLRNGVGIVFHVTPSNVPTNFCYSFAFGLLTGNANIVKVPSINFPQVDIICKEIKKLFNNKRFRKIFKNNLFVRYKSEESNITEKYSKISDGRIMWGSDESIGKLKKIKTKIDTIDVVFKDKYSFCILDAKKITLLKKKDLDRLAFDFYNDSYILDQNACSSPHLVIWRGNNKSIDKAKEIFWNKINLIVEKKYFLEETHAVKKYLNFCLDASNFKDLKNYSSYKNLVNRVELNNLPSKITNLKGIFGYFYEYNCLKLSKIKNIIDPKIQTITYFGFPRREIINFLKKTSSLGINRVVPVGKALNMGFVWDGFEIDKKLTKLVELI